MLSLPLENSRVVHGDLQHHTASALRLATETNISEVLREVGPQVSELTLIC